MILISALCFVLCVQTHLFCVCVISHYELKLSCVGILKLISAICIM